MGAAPVTVLVPVERYGTVCVLIYDFGVSKNIFINRYVVVLRGVVSLISPHLPVESV